MCVLSYNEQNVVALNYHMQGLNFIDETFFLRGCVLEVITKETNASFHIKLLTKTQKNMADVFNDFVHKAKAKVRI